MRKSLPLLTAIAILCVSGVPGPLVNPAAAATDQPPEAASGSTSMIPSERDAQAKLEQAGYTNIRNVRSGPEGISAVATKDGREMSLVLDSYGNIRQR